MKVQRKTLKCDKKKIIKMKSKNKQSSIKRKYLQYLQREELIKVETGLLSNVKNQITPLATIYYTFLPFHSWTVSANILYRNANVIQHIHKGATVAINLHTFTYKIKLLKIIY